MTCCKPWITKVNTCNTARNVRDVDSSHTEGNFLILVQTLSPSSLNRALIVISCAWLCKVFLLVTSKLRYMKLYQHTNQKSPFLVAADKAVYHQPLTPNSENTADPWNVYIVPTNLLKSVFM